MILTDKQLNAYAANAIGLVMPAWGHCNDYGVTIGSERDGPIYWSPLTDDGDAFRLAVTLQLEVYHANDEGDAVYAGYYPTENTGMKYCIEYYDDLSHQGDATSATRRAIVRAAADMGKAKLRERGK